MSENPRKNITVKVPRDLDEPEAYVFMNTRDGIVVAQRSFCVGPHRSSLSCTILAKDITVGNLRDRPGVLKFILSGIS